jgi:hypothetical protein
MQYQIRAGAQADDVGSERLRMIWTVFWKNKLGAQNHSDRAATFHSLDEALKFYQLLQTDGRRVREVVGPCGETLGAALSGLLVPAEGN